MNAGVIIPAYNVGSRIDHVLSNVMQLIPADRILVVNDGSTDQTGTLARAKNVRVIEHGENRGKGAALRSGFQAAGELGLDGVITLDGDGQHAVDRIPAFLRIADEEGCDLILGCRKFSPGAMPVDRILSNRISSALVSLIAGKRIPDSQCGFRYISCQLLARLSLTASHYEMETELLVKAIRSGSHVGFCPVPVIYDRHPSHIHRGRDTWRFCRLLLRLLTEK